MEIDGKKVDKVLLEEKVSIEDELYLSITTDRLRGCPVLLASRHGGVDIEEIMTEHPDLLLTEEINIFRGLQNHQCYKISNKIGLKGPSARGFIRAASALYDIYKKYDASLIEINPLALTGDGGAVALDGKIDIDNNALFRLKDMSRREAEFDSPREFQASQHRITYVELEGDIGIYVTGAGLALTGMDAITKKGGSPANFCESGGATYDAAAHALDVILSNENVKVLLIVLYGLVSRADVICEGLAPALAEKAKDLPVVAFLSGTMEDRAKETMKKIAGIESEPSFESAIDRAVSLSMGLEG